MSGYGSFSAVYDRLMSDFDYAGAAGYLVNLAKKHGSPMLKPLDLACGSGRLAAELVKLGFDPVCADGSPEMLSLAKERLPADTLLLCQDMTELDLNDTVDVCFCTMDSVNYITTKTALKAAFKRLAIFTDRGGVFIFDADGERKFTDELADGTYTYDLDDLYLVWNTGYSPRTRKARYELTWFERDGGAWRRFDEEQEQRCWTRDELVSTLEECGFAPEAEYDAYTLSPPKADSRRIHYVFKKV